MEKHELLSLPSALSLDLSLSKEFAALFVFVSLDKGSSRHALRHRTAREVFVVEFCLLDPTLSPFFSLFSLFTLSFFLKKKLKKLSSRRVPARGDRVGRVARRPDGVEPPLFPVSPLVGVGAVVVVFEGKLFKEKEGKK